MKAPLEFEACSEADQAHGNGAYQSEPIPFELRVLLGLTRRLPAVRGAGAVANMLKRWYLRKPRPPVVADVHDWHMRVDPHQACGGALLFYPHLYDREEVKFLRRTLQPGATFVDVGANVGFYSHLAASLVGPHGTVLAIEADLVSFEHLQENVRRNGFHQVRTVNAGAADEAGVLPLWISTQNRSGSSFLFPTDESVEVLCRPLLDLVREADIGHIDAMKLDIEGFEFRVLRRFFEDAPLGLHPETILVEHHADWTNDVGGDAVELLQGHGYDPVRQSGLNVILQKGSA